MANQPITLYATIIASLVVAVAMWWCMRGVRYVPPKPRAVAAAYSAAVDYALEMYESEGADACAAFLKMWAYGDWKQIALDFPTFDLSTTNDKRAVAVSEEK